MAPRTKAQYEAIRAQSTASIKAAALKLFAHRGYHSTSISQIAKEAGISKGLLYNYFESKEALLEDLITEAVEVGEAFLGQLDAVADTPAGRLRWLTEATFAAVQDNRTYWKLMAALSLQDEVLTGLMPMLKRKQEEGINALAVLFSAMGSSKPREMAYYYAAVLDGLLLHYIQMEDGYPLDAMKALVLERFISD